MQRICERQGRLNSELAKVCTQYVLAHPDASLVQRYQVLDVADDVVRLTQVARDAEDWAAEARAWLRVLENEPNQSDALRRLTRLYSDAGQAKRAYATLCLRLSQTEELETQSRLITQIARWAKYFPELEADPESLIGELLEKSLGTPLEQKVLLLIDAMFQEGDIIGTLVAMACRYPAATNALVHQRIAFRSDNSSDDASEQRERIILRALSAVNAPSTLIPAFEYFISETGKPEFARRGFRVLKERAMGQHGRRALAYREGRMLMEIGCEKDALHSFSQSFSSPQPTVRGRNLRRARGSLSPNAELGGPLGEAQLQLANASQIGARRLELLAQAAETFENRLSNPGKAFEIYLQGWRATGDKELASHAKRVATKLKESDPKAAVTAFGELIEHLRGLAEGAWDDEEKIDKLSQISALYALDCDAPELAVATTDEAFKPRS